MFLAESLFYKWWWFYPSTVAAVYHSDTTFCISSATSLLVGFWKIFGWLYT